MDSNRLKQVLEAALLAAGRPLSLADLEAMLAEDAAALGRGEIRNALAELAEEWQGRSLALQQVASGYRAQVRAEFEPWLSRLWEEKPPRYSRALLETLAVIAYRQPVTRPEIEEIRGVSISTQIMRTLQEREWVRIVGHRDAPGKPAMYGTTRQFLDYFNLRSLDQLPPIAEIRDLESDYPELALEDPGQLTDAGGHLRPRIPTIRTIPVARLPPDPPRARGERSPGRRRCRAPAVAGGRRGDRADRDRAGSAAAPAAAGPEQPLSACRTDRGANRGGLRRYRGGAGRVAGRGRDPGSLAGCGL